MLKVGDTLQDRYEIREIRRGGLKVVYIAFDKVSEKTVTIVTPLDRYTDQKDLIEGFLDQSRIVIKLRRCPHIVRAERVEEIEGKPYIFYEYIEGRTLGDEIRNQSLDPIRLLDVAIQFCEGMDCVHNVDLGDGEKGVVHRDIKPSHILITKQGVVKITDFDIAKPLGSPARFIAGTPPYMSPEQFETMEVDQRSDIYSFGVVLYEMLTGQMPLPKPNGSESMFEHYKHYHQEVTPVSPLRARSVNRVRLSPTDKELSDIILKCLEKRPDDRYQSFRGLREDLVRAYRKLLGDQETKTVTIGIGTITERTIDREYLGVGRVLDTGYAHQDGTGPADYDPDNPTGWRTGQWIDVEVIKGKMYFNKWFGPGEIIRGVWSYGGDVGIVGKPKVGDLVGYYEEGYAKIWKMIVVR